MTKQKVGILMFWIGVIGLLFNYVLQWVLASLAVD
jgi:Co/Zn/Cd efflux system component